MRALARQLVKKLTKLADRLERLYQRQFGIGEHLTADEAAAYLGMARQKFNRLVRAGVVAPIPGKKRQRRYAKSALTDFRERKPPGARLRAANT